MTKHTHGRRESDGGDGRDVRGHRIEQYSNPSHPANWHGASTQENIDRWSDRASRNSQEPPRASGSRASNGVPERNLDPPFVHSTGPTVKLHDTSAPPRTKPDVDGRIAPGGKSHSPDDFYNTGRNHAGDSTFMPTVRRTVGGS